MSNRNRFACRLIYIEDWTITAKYLFSTGDREKLVAALNIGRLYNSSAELINLIGGTVKVSASGGTCRTTPTMPHRNIKEPLGSYSSRTELRRLIGSGDRI